MKINKLTQIYFSPTGTTKRIVSTIAASIHAPENKSFDLTRPEARDSFNYITNDPEELLLLGLPVYEEKVPEIVWDALSRLKGNGQPIMPVAVYGNIGFGIALKQLDDWALKAGFIVVAGATFIGEHSFSHATLPLAKDRPDMMDLYRAKLFAQKTMEKLEPISFADELEPLDLPGTLPLIAKLLPKESARFFAHNPNHKPKLCAHCNKCYLVCPSGAIDPATLLIDKEKCLFCYACVRACAPAARKIRLKVSPVVKSTLKTQTHKNHFPKLYI